MRYNFHSLLSLLSLFSLLPSLLFLYINRAVFMVLPLLLLNQLHHPLEPLIGNRDGLEDCLFHLLRNVFKSTRDFAYIHHDEDQVIEHDDHHDGDDGVQDVDECGQIDRHRCQKDYVALG